MNDLDSVVFDRNSFSYREIIGNKAEWTPRQNPRPVTASANVNVLDDLVRVDCTAGAVVMTLETAVGCDGRQHTFKKIDASANAMTIDGLGSETIDGAATVSTTTRYATFVVKSNGTNWDLISHKVVLTTDVVGTLPIGNGGTGNTTGTATINANLTGLVTSSGNATALALGQLTNALGADVALNNTANFFDGPSVAQGTTGTWFASGTVTLTDTALSSVTYVAKLWDGTTVISSATIVTGVTGAETSVALSGYLASPAGDIRISVRDFTATTGKIIFNGSGTSKDSTIFAFRIA